MVLSAQYSELVKELLGYESDFLKTLHPKEPLEGYAGELPIIRQATDADLSGGKPVGSLFPLVRAALLYYYDSIPEIHPLLSDLPGPLVEYWRGMVYRREAEFDNARAAFSRAGEISFFTPLHEAATKHSALFARQFTWDPYLLAGQCEQFKFGDFELEKELVAMQRVEFYGVLDYTWRQCVQGSESA